jgi:hypothetical protein
VRHLAQRRIEEWPARYVDLDGGEDESDEGDKSDPERTAVALLLLVVVLLDRRRKGMFGMR